MTDSTHKYDDIIGLTHHVSAKHPQMPLSERAAQFSPFAALTGFDAAIKETARLTERKRELSEEEKEELDRSLNQIALLAKDRPEVVVEYFLDDEKKEGGMYVTETFRLRRIDRTERVLLTEDRRRIPLDSLSSIRLKENL